MSSLPNTPVVPMSVQGLNLPTMLNANGQADTIDVWDNRDRVYNRYRVGAVLIPADINRPVQDILLHIRNPSFILTSSYDIDTVTHELFSTKIIKTLIEDIPLSYDERGQRPEDPPSFLVRSGQSLISAWDNTPTPPPMSPHGGQPSLTNLSLWPSDFSIPSSGIATGDDPSRKQLNRQNYIVYQMMVTDQNKKAPLYSLNLRAMAFLKAITDSAPGTAAKPVQIFGHAVIFRKSDYDREYKTVTLCKSLCFHDILRVVQRYPIISPQEAVLINSYNNMQDNNMGAGSKVSGIPDLGMPPGYQEADMAARIGSSSFYADIFGNKGNPQSTDVSDKESALLVLQRFFSQLNKAMPVVNKAADSVIKSRLSDSGNNIQEVKFMRTVLEDTLSLNAKLTTEVSKCRQLLSRLFEENTRLRGQLRNFTMQKQGYGMIPGNNSPGPMGPGMMGSSPHGFMMQDRFMQPNVNFSQINGMKPNIDNQNMQQNEVQQNGQMTGANSRTHSDAHRERNKFMNSTWTENNDNV